MSSFCVIELYHCCAALETDAALHFAAHALACLSAVEGQHGAGGHLHGKITCKKHVLKSVMYKENFSKYETLTKARVVFIRCQIQFWNYEDLQIMDAHSIGLGRKEEMKAFQIM